MHKKGRVATGSKRSRRDGRMCLGRPRCSSGRGDGDTVDGDTPRNRSPWTSRNRRFARGSGGRRYGGIMGEPGLRQERPHWGARARLRRCGHVCEYEQQSKPEFDATFRLTLPIIRRSYRCWQWCVSTPVPLRKVLGESLASWCLASNRWLVGVPQGLNCRPVLISLQG